MYYDLQELQERLSRRAAENDDLTQQVMSQVGGRRKVIGADIEPVPMMPMPAPPPVPQGKSLGVSIIDGVAQVASAAVSRPSQPKAGSAIDTFLGKPETALKGKNQIDFGNPPQVNPQAIAPPRITRKLNVEAALRPPSGAAQLSLTRDPNVARRLPRFQHGGDVTPHLGRKILYGEGGAELAIDEDGGTQLIGTNGAEVGVPTRPAMIVPLHGAAAGNGQPGARTEPQQQTGVKAILGPHLSGLVEAALGSPTGQPDPATVRAAQTPGFNGDAPTQHLLSDGAASAQEPQTRPRRALPPPADQPADRFAPAASERAMKKLRVAVEQAARAPQSGETQPPDGINYDPTRSATRRRVADVPRHIEGQIEYEEQNPEQDGNGRWKSAALSALIGGAQAAAQTGDWRAGLAGAATGGILGAARPQTDEQLRQGYRTADLKRRLAEAMARKKSNLELEGQSIGNDLKRAQVDYYRTGKPLEAQGRALARERTLIKANLGSLKGQRLDPSNPRHAAFLERAALAGYFIDPDEWNNASSNQVSITEVDPDNPTQVRQKFFNKVTREITDVAQKGYVQPVGKDGMTEAQRRGDADRDASRAATAERFKQTFGLGVDKFKAQLERGMRQDALRSFRVEVADKLPRVRAIEREIGDIRKRVGEGSARAGEMDRIPVLEAEAATLAGEFEAAKARALGAATSHPGATHAPAPASGGAYSGKRFSRSKLEAMRPAFGGKSAAEIERIIKSQGGVVY